jgi:uncharacterized protein (DUF433 family)
MAEPNIFDTPIYGMTDAARYLRLPYQTLRYWTRGRESIKPIVDLASAEPPRLSFNNLLECHMISSMKAHYDLRLPKVRSALKELARLRPSRHPLIDQIFETDRINLFVANTPDSLVNLNAPNQLIFKATVQTFLDRVEEEPKGMYRFFPFVEKIDRAEPKIIVINPAVAFGRPVITGTGIPTAVIASRFHARDSVSDLAREYGRSEKEIEEAIRWESRPIAA